MLHDERGVGDDAQRPVVPGRVVGDQLADAGDERAHASSHRGSIAAASSRPTSPSTCCPPDDHDPAVGDHGVDIGGAGGHDDLVGRAAGGARAVQPDGDEVGPLPRRDPAGVGPAQRAVAVGGQRVDQLGRAGSGPRSPVVSRWSRLEQPGLGEQVGQRVLVAAQAERGPGVAEPAEGADAVGQVGLGAGAGADRRAAAAEGGDVVGGEVGGVHRGGVRAEQRRGRRAGGSGCGRRTAWQASFSAGCSERCTCSGPAGGGRGDRGQLVGRDRPHGVHRRADPQPGALGQRAATRAAHASASPSENRRLDVVQRQVAGALESAGEVAGVEQGQPDAGVGGGLDQRLRHRVRVGVRPPPARVVQVVELADAGDPGQRHLGVGGPGQRQVAVRVEAGGDGVHPLAPGPERAAPVVGAPAQRPVEGVRVRVGEAGQHDARAAGTSPGAGVGDARRRRSGRRPR